MNELKHDLMQKFKPADRFKPSIEKQLSIEDDILLTLDRNEFARDGDRILFSRAFRRLQHKAQVFSNESGDHFRTRLTHTLEVSQISRSLARYLQADEYLAEAIAIGHDIGHTPFGHQGERVLDDVMMGEDDLGLIKCHFDFGGFKHNYNSLRVLDIVQSKFEKQDGLNLSWQVLEGILKHTKVKRTSSRNNKAKSWDIDLFISNPSLKDRLYLIYDHSVTLEGQIVAIADEIAQRQHDIDDGLRYTKLRMEVNKVYEDIIKICQEIIDEALATKEQCTKAIQLLRDLKTKLTVNSESKNRLFKNDSLVRDIIEYFIFDVLNYSRGVIQNGVKLINDGDRRILDKKIIDFSPIGKKFNDKLEAIVKNRILNSYKINKFDGKSRFIIRQLFKAYYTNPLQMPSYALYRLEGNLNQKADTCKIKLLLEDGNKTEMKKIDFKIMGRAIVKPLISSLKLEKINVNVEVPVDLKYLFGESSDEKEISKQFYCKLKELNGGKDDNSNQAVFLKCLIDNHYMYLATICDYISGMSDNYAKKEYKELYMSD